MGSKDTQFKAGSSGGPGRPKGARNKITKAYLDAVAKSFAKNGPEVLEIIKEKRPDVYMKLVAALVPKDLDVKHSGDLTIQVVNYTDDDE